MKEKFIIRIANTLILYVFQFLTYFLMVKKIDIQLIGIYAFSQSMLGFFTLFIDLGLSAIHFQYKSNNDFNEAFGTFFFMKILLLVSNFLIPIPYIIYKNLDPYTLKILITVVIGNFFICFSSIFQIQLEAKLKIIESQLGDLILTAIKTFLQFFILIQITKFDDPLYAITLITLFYGLIRSIYLIFLNKGEKIFHINKEILNKYIKNAIPYSGMSVIIVLNNTLGNFLLGESFGLEELALYFVIKNYIIDSLILVASSSDSLFFSIFPRFFKEKKNNQIEQIAHLFEKYGGHLFFYLIIIIILFSDSIFQIFLPVYQSSTIYLKFLIIIPFLDVINKPYGGMLTQNGNFKLAAKIGLFFNTFKMIITIILVPKTIYTWNMVGLGAWGLIISLYIYYITLSITIRLVIRHLLNIHDYSIHFLKNIIIFGVIILINKFILTPIFGQISNEIIQTIILILICTILYCIGLIGFKEIKKSDIDYLFSLLNISNYIKSYKSEKELE